MAFEPTRVRHELRRRSLTVVEVVNRTPGMRRIVFAGPELADFVSLAPDDHVKLFVPGGDGSLEARDYTPRAFDREACRLTIDFALHEAGPATRWARGAVAGDRLDVGGPRGSIVIPSEYDWWLLIGDETALPAIGRRIEELPAGKRVVSLVAVTGPDEEQPFAGAADVTSRWVHRPASEADDPAPLLALLRELVPPPGPGFIWIAAEARVARTLREYVSGALGHPSRQMKAAVYWVKGRADARERFEDATGSGQPVAG